MPVPSRSNQQVVNMIAFVTILTHILGLVGPSLAATSSSQPAENAAASTQPLWSYQVKPTNYINTAQTGSGAPYSSAHSSLFDAFTGLSQRQGALTSGGGPFLSILPIILIAAGGLLLLLPMLTMMLASPFGAGPFGGGGGGFQSYGYPQVGLNKRRSLDQMPGGGRGIIELIEHVTSTIEDLSRKYSSNAASTAPAATSGGSGGGQSSERLSKRSKALNGVGSAVATNHQQSSANEPPASQPTNHRPNDSDEAANFVNSAGSSSNNNNNNSGATTRNLISPLS